MDPLSQGPPVYHHWRRHGWVRCSAQLADRAWHLWCWTRGVALAGAWHPRAGICSLIMGRQYVERAWRWLCQCVWSWTGKHGRVADGRMDSRTIWFGGGHVGPAKALGGRAGYFGKIRRCWPHLDSRAGCCIWLTATCCRKQVVVTCSAQGASSVGRGSPVGGTPWARVGKWPCLTLMAAVTGPSTFVPRDPTTLSWIAARQCNRAAQGTGALWVAQAGAAFSIGKSEDDPAPGLPHDLLCCATDWGTHAYR